MGSASRPTAGLLATSTVPWPPGTFTTPLLTTTVPEWTGVVKVSGVSEKVLIAGSLAVGPLQSLQIPFSIHTEGCDCSLCYVRLETYTELRSCVHVVFNNCMDMGDQ